MSAPFDRVGETANGAAATDPREVGRGAPQQGGIVARALAVIRKPPADAAFETEDVAPDPVQALLALADGKADVRPSATLAEQLLDYVAPHPRKPLNLTPSRILTLLDIAADQVGRAADASDEIAPLGGAALEQELRAHRDLAERRTTLLGPTRPEPAGAVDEV